MNISEYPFPGIDSAIDEPMTGRVSLCTFSIQQKMCAYAKFSHLRKEVQTYQNIILQKYRNPIIILS